MAAQRTSFSKLQRERDRQSKAAVKRERRQGRDVEDDNGQLGDGGSIAVPSTDDSGDASILLTLEQLQREFDAGAIDFDTYDKRKSDLLGRLKI